MTEAVRSANLGPQPPLRDCAPGATVRGATRLWLLLIAALLAQASSRPARAQEVFQQSSPLGPADLGVVVNDLDPLSVRTAEYYRSRRRIPSENVVHVRLSPLKPSIAAAEFEQIKLSVELSLPSQVQALALTWTQPYRVDCMSITAAFALGVHPRFCSQPCQPTQSSPYFASTSRKPFADLRIRPTMMLAATSYQQATQLIDRGVSADGAFPYGTAYLLTTSDRARSTRAVHYARAALAARGRVRISALEAEFIEGRKDVLFYFTGAVRVPHLDTLQFLPGGIADHLTSSGGHLTDSNQMSALRWLEAGATGSYGTVMEPCAFPQKFPNPLIVMDRYLSGDTLVEAYWKSVEWPGEGVFIGEPLAAPFRPRLGLPQ